MKAVLLAGGLGTRLSEETELKPKPMIEIGGRPILWHIMKIYEAHGINEFVVCLGYRGYVIKEFFSNYFLHMADVTIDLGKNDMEIHQGRAEQWRVTLVDTGVNTMTGGRLKRIAPYVADDTFCMTYGDGVADIDIGALVEFHKSSGKAATVTGVAQPGRFGNLTLDGGSVTGFLEKPEDSGTRINGGFFVLEPHALDVIDGDQDPWERAPMERLAAQGELACYQHQGFWQPMDTLREKTLLEDLWASGAAPWRCW